MSSGACSTTSLSPFLAAAISSLYPEMMRIIGGLIRQTERLAFSIYCFGLYLQEAYPFKLVTSLAGFLYARRSLSAAESDRTARHLRHPLRSLIDVIRLPRLAHIGLTSAPYNTAQTRMLKSCTRYRPRKPTGRYHHEVPINDGMTEHARCCISSHVQKVLVARGSLGSTKHKQQQTEQQREEI